MDSKDLKKNVINGFLWKAAENGGDQLITFVISVLLARLLGPEKYGSMAVMLIFISIAQVVIQNGFQTALIRKKEADEGDFRTAAVSGLTIAAVLYAALFLSAPSIARFFRQEEIGLLLRILGLILFFGAFVSVETAWAVRRMDFKSQCRAMVAADLLSGAAGIFAAVRGLGTGALVLQQLLKFASLSVFLALFSGFRPAGSFSFAKLGELLGFGWKVLVSGLIDTVYTNLYTPFITRLFGAVPAGLYARANQFPQVLVNSAAQTVQAVMLPALSRTQDDRAATAALMRRILKLSGFVMFPAMFGLAAVSGPLVRVLLGEAWTESAGMLSLCALGYSVWHMHVLNLQAINASGRSDIYLKLEIVKKTAGTAILLLSAPYGIGAMLLARALFDFVCTVLNAWPLKKLAGYGPLSQWRDTLPELALSAVMAGAVRIFSRAAGSGQAGFGQALFSLSAGVVFGAVFYLALAALLRMESFRTLIGLIRERFPGRNG